MMHLVGSLFILKDLKHLCVSTLEATIIQMKNDS